MELTSGLREYLNLVGSVVLLTLIFYPILFYQRADSFESARFYPISAGSTAAINGLSSSGCRGYVSA